MGYTFGQILNYSSDPIWSLRWALTDRKEKLTALADWLAGFGLEGWDGSGADAARGSFVEDRRYVADALAARDQASAAVEDFDSRMIGYRAQAQALVQLAGTGRFTIAADSSIRDFYGESGLVDALSSTDKAKYDQVKAALPRQLADLAAQVDALDAQTATTLASTGALVPVARLGPSPALPGPASGTAPSVTLSGPDVLVDTGDGDDTVTVSQVADTVTVTAGGVSRSFTGLAAANIQINTKGGNDTITVSPGVTARLRLLGGAGDDSITNNGSGEAYVDGGAGDDVIIGGKFRDTIYGGQGRDRIVSTSGTDYVDGGAGDDVIFGGSGNNTLVGGAGNDMINAGTGNNEVYTAGGCDTVVNQGGKDVVYAQEGTAFGPSAAGNTVVTVPMATIPDQIVLSGSAEFQDRVRSDLQFLAGSPNGQAMLAGLGETGHTVMIAQAGFGGDAERSAHADGSAVASSEEYYNPVTGVRGSGADALVAFDPGGMDVYNAGADSSHLDPGQDDDFAPPSVWLFHELGHAYDSTHGTLWPGSYHGQDSGDAWAANVEREVVGLSVSQGGDSSTPEALVPDVVHPQVLTENSIRAELGLPDRRHYSS